ncbi:MAG: segregation/condensation protein A [Coriobacteriales bacterium]|nr:segregation/condensation protein A [Coriobacteriales bacterium]
MSYRVKIESFEGPFDLLLALVSEQKIDIGAISVTEVADQYLGYVDAMSELDMDVASDFLVVAATLLALKAASLLPEEAVSLGDDLDDLSPIEARDILIARLIAYKQFKNVASALNARLESEGHTFARQAGLESPFVGLLPDYLEGVTLHSLAVICADLAARREVFLLEAEHIAAKPIPVETRIDELVRRLERTRTLTFHTLIADESDTTVIVVNFLALLELYHRGIIDLTQEQLHGDITIEYRDVNERTPAPDTEQAGDAGADTQSAEGADGVRAGGVRAGGRTTDGQDGEADA